MNTDSQTLALLAAVFASLLVLVLFALFANLMSASGERDQAKRLMMELGLDAEALKEYNASFIERWSIRFDKTRQGEQLAARLQQADLRIAPSQFVMALLGTGVGLFLLITAAFQLTPLLTSIITVATVGLGVKFFLDARRDHYRTTLSAQMPEVATLMSNSLKAGLSVPQAFEVVADKMQSPAGSEFRRLAQEIRLGVPLTDALQRMTARLKIEELEIMVTAILIQRKSGGNLTRALAVMSSAITARHRLRNEINTMTAEGRFTSVAILIMPFVTLGILNQMMPGSVTEFLSSPIGWVVGGIFTAAQVLAFILIGRVANVKV
jgi:tight adherence protein B